MNALTNEPVPDFALDRSHTIRLLVAIGDPIRIEICSLLGRRGKLNVTEIAAHFTISRPAISHHLKVLRDAGALQSEKLGQEVFYWLDFQTLEGGLEALLTAIRNCPHPEG